MRLRLWSAALGGHLEKCDHCTEDRNAYNSCRNRHCGPQAQTNGDLIQDKTDHSSLLVVMPRLRPREMPGKQKGRTSYSAARVPAYPPLRLSCQLSSHSQTGALPRTAHRSHHRVAAAASGLSSTARSNRPGKGQPLPPLRHRHDDPGCNPSPLPVARSAALGHLMTSLPHSPPIHEDATIAATHARSVRVHRQFDTQQPVSCPFQCVLYRGTEAYVPFSHSRRKNIGLTEAVRGHRSSQTRHSKRITERFVAV